PLSPFGMRRLHRRTWAPPDVIGPGSQARVEQPEPDRADICHRGADLLGLIHDLLIDKAQRLPPDASCLGVTNVILRQVADARVPASPIRLEDDPRIAVARVDESLGDPAARKRSLPSGRGQSAGRPPPDTRTL